MEMCLCESRETHRNTLKNKLHGDVKTEMCCTPPMCILHIIIIMYVEFYSGRRVLDRVETVVVPRLEKTDRENHLVEREKEICYSPMESFGSRLMNNLVRVRYSVGRKKVKTSTNRTNRSRFAVLIRV